MLDESIKVVSWLKEHKRNSFTIQDIKSEVNLSDEIIIEVLEDLRDRGAIKGTKDKLSNEFDFCIICDRDRL